MELDKKWGVKAEREYKYAAPVFSFTEGASEMLKAVEGMLKTKIEYYVNCEKEFGQTSHSLSKLALLRETLAELQTIKPL